MTVEFPLLLCDLISTRELPLELGVDSTRLGATFLTSRLLRFSVTFISLFSSLAVVVELTMPDED